MPDRSYEQRSHLPLTVLAIAFLVVYALPIAAPDAPRLLLRACTTLSWAIWAVFAADYVYRLVRASDRLGFVSRHLFELATVLLPMLRPLQALRVLTLANLLTRRRPDEALLSAARAVAGAVLLLVTVGGLAMLDAERGHPGANIETLGDSLWWAVVTITTVGYGDFYPVTLVGRLIATVMMLLGIALLGVVTAGIAGWFVTQVDRARRAEDER